MMDVPGHKDSSTIEGEVKSQRRRVTSKKVPENTTLKDNKSATNKADTGQMGSSRYEEEVESQTTPSSHWGKEVQEKGEVSQEDFLKKMSKIKETDQRLKELHKRSEEIQKRGEVLQEDFIKKG